MNIILYSCALDTGTLCKKFIKKYYWSNPSVFSSSAQTMLEICVTWASILRSIWNKIIPTCTTVIYTDVLYWFFELFKYLPYTDECSCIYANRMLFLRNKIIEYIFQFFPYLIGIFINSSINITSKELVFSCNLW